MSALDSSVWEHAVRKQQLQRAGEDADAEEEEEEQPTRRVRGMTMAMAHPEYLEAIGVVAPMQASRRRQDGSDGDNASNAAATNASAVRLTETGELKANNRIEPLNLFGDKKEKVLFGLNDFISKMNDERVYQSKFAQLSPKKKKQRHQNTRTDAEFTLNFAYIDHKKPVDAYGNDLTESSDEDLLRANKHVPIHRSTEGYSVEDQKLAAIGAKESNKELFRRLVDEGKEGYLDAHAKRAAEPILLRDNVHMQGRQVNKGYSLEHPRAAPRKSLIPVYDASTKETFKERFQRISSRSFEDNAVERSRVLGDSDDIAHTTQQDAKDIPDDPESAEQAAFMAAKRKSEANTGLNFRSPSHGPDSEKHNNTQQPDAVMFEKSVIHVIGDSSSDSDFEHKELRKQAQQAMLRERSLQKGESLLRSRSATTESAAAGGMAASVTRALSAAADNQPQPGQAFTGDEPLGATALARPTSSSSSMHGVFADLERASSADHKHINDSDVEAVHRNISGMFVSAMKKVQSRELALHMFQDSMEVRRHFRSQFEEHSRLGQLDSDDNFTWDYVFVFKTGSSDDKHTVRMAKLRPLLRKILAAGLNVGLFQSIARNFVYCLVGGSESRYQQEALRLGVDLELDKTEVFLRCMDSGLPITQMMSLELTRDINYNIHRDSRATAVPPGWSVPGIEVVVLNKTIYEGLYHRERAVIQDVKNTSMQCKIKLLGNNRGKLIWVNESDLATVIPGVGRKVRILRGEYRECLASIVRLEQQQKQAVVRVLEYPKGVEPPDPFAEGVKREDIWLTMDYNILSKAHLGLDRRDNNWKKLFGPFDLGMPGPQGYSNGNRMHMYKTYARKPCKWQTLFPDTERLKLLRSILVSTSTAGCADINMSHYITDADHPLKAAFPLHNGKVKKLLGHKWVDLKYLLFNAMNQPVEDIRAYYGEEVAFYFAFLAYYNRWLLPLALLGVGFYILSVTALVDAGYITLFAPFVAIWATVFFEYWKKEESKLRVRFGMSDFTRRATDRSSFKGAWGTSAVNGAPEMSYAYSKKAARVAFSGFITFLALGCVTAIVVAILVLSAWLVAWDTTYGAYATSSIFAVQIKICDVLFTGLANALTEFENHRHEEGYQASMVIKVYIFKFINNYNMLIYIAFVKRYVTTCINDNCLEELQTHLAGIFISLLLINNLMEAVGPAFARWGAAKRRKLKGVRDESELSHPEKEFDREKYEPFAEYDEINLQFGYISLFVVAFPLAPILAFVNNLFEVQFDAKRLQELHRRPAPRGVRNMGMWYSMLTLTSMLSVVTNCAMAFLLNDLLTVDPNATQGSVLAPSTTALWCFIGTEHVLVLVKLWMSHVIDDNADGVLEHLQQQHYLISVLIKDPLADHDLDKVLEQRNSMDGTAVLAIQNPTVKCGRLMFPSYDELRIKFARQRAGGRWKDDPDTANSRDPLIFLQALDVADIPEVMPITGHEIH